MEVENRLPDNAVKEKLDEDVAVAGVAWTDADVRGVEVDEVGATKLEDDIDPAAEA